MDHPGEPPVPRPSYTPTPRIGDTEREQAVTALSEHYAAGRIDHVELDTRLEAAYRARTLEELRALFVDLPGKPPFGRTPRPGGAREEGRRVRIPVLPILVALAVILVVATEGRAFFLLPMVWFWFGFARHSWGPGPHRR
jgi:hypothetical protein